MKNTAYFFITATGIIITLIYGFIYLTLGKVWLKKTWFAVAFLVFMVPLPDFIISGLNFKLKFWASDLAASILNFAGVAAIREGSFMLFNEEKLAIGDVCSGLRSLISLVALGVLFTWFNREKGPIHVTAVLLSILPAAILGNGLRIFIISLAVNSFGGSIVFTPIILDYDLHLISGMFIFMGAFASLLGVNSLLNLVLGGNKK